MISSVRKIGHASTVTNQGKTRWMIIEENLGADRLIEFLEAVISDADRKIFLILDNLRAHHSKLVKAWLETRKDQIEIFYLPSYSPELNPDGRLNASLKHAISTAVPVKTKAKLKAAAESQMNSLAKSPNIVAAFSGIHDGNMQPNYQRAVSINILIVWMFSLFNTGARVQEILNLRICDLRLVSPCQVRVHGKGNKVGLCPIWRNAAQLLQELIRTLHSPSHNPAEQRVFSTTAALR